MVDAQTVGTDIRAVPTPVVVVPIVALGLIRGLVCPRGRQLFEPKQLRHLHLGPLWERLAKALQGERARRHVPERKDHGLEAILRRPSDKVARLHVRQTSPCAAKAAKATNTTKAMVRSKRRHATRHAGEMAFELRQEHEPPVRTILRRTRRGEVEKLAPRVPRRLARKDC